MGKGRKELLESAPWRVNTEDDDKFKDAKLKVTNQPGSTPTMHVPGKKTYKNGGAVDADDSITEIDPELRYSFKRNFQAYANPMVLGTAVKSIFRRVDCEADNRPWENRLSTFSLWCHLKKLCGAIKGAYLEPNASGLCTFQGGVVYGTTTNQSLWGTEFLQRVFSIDTLVKPLPIGMQYHVSRNLSFFTRIFTQFSDPEGIANAQKSLGLGQEERIRKVR